MPKKTKTLPAGPCFGHTMLRGGQIEGKFLRCYYLLSEESETPLRVGFAVSSRVFNAVRRNRIKRMLREAFRLVYGDLPRGYDFVCVPRVGAVGTLSEYQEAIRTLASRAAAGWRPRRGQIEDA